MNMFTVASELGMTVERLLNTMTQTEFYCWLAWLRENNENGNT